MDFSLILLINDLILSLKAMRLVAFSIAQSEDSDSGFILVIIQLS